MYVETILQEQAEKLTSYEKMQKAVRHEYNSINNQMGLLIKNGEYHSAHYSKIAGKKLLIEQF